MTQDEIIEMAASAGIIPWTKHEYIGGKKFSASDEGLDGDAASVIQFAKLVAAKATAAEREAIIQIIKTTPFSNWFQADVIEAIRARGQA